MRRFGDRKDAALIRKMDAMHTIMPMMYRGRCNNEAFISERIDLTQVNEYLAKKNADNPDYKYNLFQVIVTAVLKLIILRPKFNRFIKNQNYYQRHEASASFVIKKVFQDESEEGMAFIRAKNEDSIDTIHNEIYRQVTRTRKGEKDSTDSAMDILNKVPRFVCKAAFAVLRLLDEKGWIPSSLIVSDPYHASVILTNLGSIKLHAGYHHLTNWGTTSVFVVVGEKKLRPFYNPDGSYEMKDSIDLGFTIDERIGDGYYFSKSIRLFKKILENPELLERPLSEEVDYE